MRSSEGATNTALKTSQPLNGNIRMARLGILTLSSGWTCFLTNITIIVNFIITVHNDHKVNLTVYVCIWPLLSPRSGELSGHGSDPWVHVQRSDRLCRRRSASGLKKTKKQNKQRPDQTDFVGGDLPQVFHYFEWGGWALGWYCEQNAHLQIQLYYE